jgi:hypothetical protein
LGEFIRSRKPKRILGNIEGIQLPFHLPLGITFSLWVYSGPQQAEVAVPPPETSGDSAFARRLAVEELRARQRATEELRLARPPTPTIPAHFLAEFMEMSLQLKRGHSCPCCFDVVTKETIYVSPCGHILCQGCHKGVMGANKLCPTCRQEL